MPPAAARMQLLPTFERFKALAESAGIVPVWREFLFDADTAVTAYAKLAEPPFGFLLESVVGGEQWARYSFLGTRPSGAWRLERGVVSWWSPDEGWTEVATDDPLGDLDARLRARAPADVEGLPRFWGGAVGYFAYDVVRQIERLPEAPPDDLGLPDGLFVFTDIVLAIDNLKGRAMALAAVPVDDADSEAALRERYDAAAGRTAEVVRRLAEASAPPPLSLTGEPEADAAFESSMTRTEYEAGVERIREYIRAGDAFQVVLSQRLRFDLAASPFALYRALRSLNPSPYLYFLELDGLSLVGARPRCSCASRTARSWCARSRERGRAAARPPRSVSSPRTCGPTRRSWPSTGCSWTSGATTWVAWPSTDRSPFRISWSSSATRMSCTW
jgi:anthranilate synthase component I